MDDSNPYASPLASCNVPFVRAAGPPQRKYPWLSRALTLGLLFDMIAVAGVVVMAFYVGWLELQIPKQELSPDVLVVFGFAILALVGIWPVTTLAALIYTATVDRGARGWLLKTLTSALMFLLWLLLCLVGIVFT